MNIRRAVVGACALALVGAGVSTSGAGAQSGRRVPPPIRTVFVVNLENKGYDETFGPGSPATYLTNVLRPRGILLTQYYGTAHASLGNYIAQISGQGPTPQSQSDCQFYGEFVGAGTVAPQQAVGQGCVYPASVQTVADQLSASRLSWKGYMEDMGNDPKREPATCGHVRLGAADPTSVARRGDQYAAKHDPFVWFHTIIDDAARCDARVVNLNRLPQDLASAATTPNFVFITPNLCSDGHDPRCVDGREGGLVAINTFLTQWVPLILNSAAFRADGMLIVTFDEADGIGREGSGACCGEKPLPGARYAPGFNGPGGGRVGAVVLSPFVKPATLSAVPYNHYSLLKTVEALFGLKPLGYAAAAGPQVFGPDVFSGAAPHPPAR